MDDAAVTAITAAVDYAPIITGIGAVGAASVLVIIAVVGLRKLTGAIRGA